MAVTLDYLLVEDAPPAAIITLNRPQQLNALSTGLMNELASELQRQAALGALNADLTAVDRDIDAPGDLHGKPSDS